MIALFLWPLSCKLLFSKLENFPEKMSLFNLLDFVVETVVRRTTSKLQQDLQSQLVLNQDGLDKLVEINRAYVSEELWLSELEYGALFDVKEMLDWPLGFFAEKRPDGYSYSEESLQTSWTQSYVRMQDKACDHVASVMRPTGFKYTRTRNVCSAPPGTMEFLDRIGQESQARQARLQDHQEVQEDEDDWFSVENAEMKPIPKAKKPFSKSGGVRGRMIHNWNNGKITSRGQRERYLHVINMTGPEGEPKFGQRRILKSTPFAELSEDRKSRIIKNAESFSAKIREKENPAVLPPSIPCLRRPSRPTSPLSKSEIKPLAVKPNTFAVPDSVLRRKVQLKIKAEEEAKREAEKQKEVEPEKSKSSGRIPVVPVEVPTELLAPTDGAQAPQIVSRKPVLISLRGVLANQRRRRPSVFHSNFKNDYDETKCDIFLDAGSSDQERLVCWGPVAESEDYELNKVGRELRRNNCCKIF